ncbi:MAG: hypothetical protein AAF639_10635 [Chloroflexota bacterium]
MTDQTSGDWAASFSASTRLKWTPCHQGPLFAVIKVSNEDVPRVLPRKDGAFLTHRFRSALLGERAVYA